MKDRKERGGRREDKLASTGHAGLQARSPDSSPALPAPEPLSSVKWDDTNPLKAGQWNRRAHREEGKGGQTLELPRFLGRNWERQALRLVGRGLEGLEDHASQAGMILLLFTSVATPAEGQS